ncbi:DUF3515 domain-containing protein [Actinomadura litoris]|uniref:DUF3515 domain-containing protein n=1 Tax=Actinomadura litoris TaxID=2678616 RepID=UPI001FA7B9F6|nr:DUF3515 domain-containing protein [Actinomadura litoris]
MWTSWASSSWRRSSRSRGSPAPSPARSSISRAASRAALLAGTGLLAAACGDGAVEIPVPKPDAATARLCEGLRLPEKVHGLSRRDASPDSPLTAAWGSPAIALRCGVGRPAALHPESQLVDINGISWFGQPTGRPVTFTAVARQAYVEVTVPAKYNPAGDVLIELSGAITSTIPTKPEGQI